MGVGGGVRTVKRLEKPNKRTVWRAHSMGPIFTPLFVNPMMFGFVGGQFVVCCSCLEKARRKREKVKE